MVLDQSRIVTNVNRSMLSSHNRNSQSFQKKKLTIGLSRLSKFETPARSGPDLKTKVSFIKSKSRQIVEVAQNDQQEGVSTTFISGMDFNTPSSNSKFIQSSVNYSIQVHCQNCKKYFSRKAGERHVSICSQIINKPSRLVRNKSSGGVAGEFSSQSSMNQNSVRVINPYKANTLHTQSKRKLEDLSKSSPKTNSKDHVPNVRRGRVVFASQASVGTMSNKLVVRSQLGNYK